MTLFQKILSTLLVCFLNATMLAQTLEPSDAKNHIGERVTVCGKVASAHYAARSRGNPTFINLGQAYPNQIFTVLIWGSDRPKFGSPDQDYRDKRICVKGKVSDFRGVPEIVAYEPAQITVQ